MTTLFLIRRRGVAASASELEAALTRLRTLEELPAEPLGVRWLRSYALREADGRFGLACVFAAGGAEALQRHARRAALPADAVDAVQDTHVHRAFAPTRVYWVRRGAVGADAAELGRRLATARRIADEDMPRQVSWLRSYALPGAAGGFGTACLYQAMEPAALHEHAVRAGLPVDEITPVLGRIVFRDAFPDQALPA